MRREGRITKVPYQQGIAVDTYWDLGHSDTTAIVFHQQVGLQDRILRGFWNALRATVRTNAFQPDAAGKFVTLAGHEAIQAGCLTLTRVREILADVVDVRRRGGDRHLHYVNGLKLFGATDAADLPDDLHPNPAGYARMGERFVREVFGEDGLGLSSGR